MQDPRIKDRGFLSASDNAACLSALEVKYERLVKEMQSTRGTILKDGVACQRTHEVLY